MAKKTLYPVVLELEDGVWGAVFPDFDGCVSVGDTIPEAIKGAEEALQLHVNDMVADGEDLPEPSDLPPTAEPLEELLKRRRTSCLAMVPVRAPAPPKRVQITMDEGLLEQIDSETNNRSAFLAEAARKELERRRV